MVETIHITWHEIYKRVEEIKQKIMVVDKKGKIATIPPVWGVPRGGQIIAGLIGNAVDSEIHSNYIIDDIIDSGKTRERFEQIDYDHCRPRREFIALIDKRKEDLLGKWIVFPWETPITKDLNSKFDIENTIIRQLQYIGEDAGREGLKETPSRIVKSWQKLYSGYNQDLKSVCTVFDHEKYTGMLLVKNIELFSMCEHHLLPFVGKCHIAYIPKKKVIGLSKLVRIMEIYSRRLQIQERLTDQIADAIQELLQPLGVGVVIEAEHLCMRMRGVEKQNSVARTTSLRGVFYDKTETRNEFLNAIK